MKILKEIKGIYLFVFLSSLFLSCTAFKKDIKKNVTYIVTPERVSDIISLGDSFESILSKKSRYKIVIRDAFKYGVNFNRIEIVDNDEVIVYVIYHPENKDVLNIGRIVCVHRNCTTETGVHVGMSISDLRLIHPEKSYELQGGITSSIGYYVPEVLVKHGEYFKESNVVIELERMIIDPVRNIADTIVTALIVETY